MRRRFLWNHVFGTLSTALAVVSVVACGDVYADPEVTITETEANERDASGDVSVGVPLLDGGFGRPEICPATRPRENTACGQLGTTCEYGRSPDPLCNSVLVCRGAEAERYWDPASNEGCHSRMCPVAASVATLDNTPCNIEGATAADEAVCNMTDGVCACTTGRDGASIHERKWICVIPISACPPNRPLAGAPCEGTLWCDYGSCRFKRGLLMECKDGVWITGGAPCQ